MSIAVTLSIDAGNVVNRVGNNQSSEPRKTVFIHTRDGIYSYSTLTFGDLCTYMSRCVDMRKAYFVYRDICIVSSENFNRLPEVVDLYLKGVPGLEYEDE